MLMCGSFLCKAFIAPVRTEGLLLRGTTSIESVKGLNHLSCTFVLAYLHLEQCGKRCCVRNCLMSLSAQDPRSNCSAWEPACIAYKTGYTSCSVKDQTAMQSTLVALLQLSLPICKSLGCVTSCRGSNSKASAARVMFNKHIGKR